MCCVIKQFWNPPIFDQLMGVYEWIHSLTVGWKIPFLSRETPVKDLCVKKKLKLYIHAVIECIIN